MHKRLRWSISISQMLLAAAAFNWDKGVHSELILLKYAQPVRNIIISLNFPIAILWSPIIYAIERTSHRGTPSLVAAVIFGCGMFFTVALFWFVVVTETELRSAGRSLIRSSSGSFEIFKAVVLCTIGIGAIICACWDVHRLIILGENNRFMLRASSMVEASISGFLLLAWAIVLITISMRDLALLYRKNREAGFIVSTGWRE